MSDLVCDDLFAGAGGTSTGLAQACKKLSRTPELTAINHWNIAVETHRRNHPWARHFCTGIDAIHPGELHPKGRMDLLVASPECTHHSNARGGKPMCNQSRTSPWLVMKWLQDLYVDSVLIENVPEFQQWGPLGADGRPLKSKKGHSFEAFISNLRSIGYNVEWRVLNAADYGDATVRERLFIQARRGRNKKIYWPEKTHFACPEQADLFRDTRQRWRPAREIIDWSLPSQSIFSRKKPLVNNTLERIAAGLKKFCGAKADPFLVVLRNHADGRSLNDPVPTLTASGQHVGLCQPFVLGQQSCAAARSTDMPLPTISTAGAISMVQPFFVEYHGSSRPGAERTRSIDRPLPTQDTNNRFGLVQPFIAELRSGKAANSIDDPLSTVTTKGAHHALVEPFVLSMEHSRGGFLMPVNHGSGDHRTYSVDRPMPTVTTVDAWGLVEPMIMEYYGSQNGLHPVSEPLNTITTKDRFGLIQFGDGLYLDILFRMLHWRELAAAQSFPGNYDFAGNREQIVKQIGNAVPVRMAQSLCEMLIQ